MSVPSDQFPANKPKKDKFVNIGGKAYRLSNLYNNPGNIEDGPMTPFAGSVGVYKTNRLMGGMKPFHIFDHKVSGLRGLAKDVTSKIRDGLTLEEIVKKYAPAFDNEYQAKYIEYVVNNTAKYSGLDKNYFYLGGDLDTDKIVEGIIRSKMEFENKGIAFEVDGKFVPATEYYDVDSIKKGVQLRETDYDKNKRYLGDDGMEEYFSDKVTNQKDNSLYSKDTPDLTAADFGFQQEDKT